MQTVSGSMPTAASEDSAPASEVASTAFTAGFVTPAAPAEQALVQLDRVSKQYRGVNALRNVSFSIQRGEIFGLLGPNGAGKSTLLKLILGFLSADSGTIKAFGSGDLTAAHARIGYLPEQPRYHSNFTGREYLEFQSRLAGLSAGDARAVVARALRLVGIEEAANRRISTYSKGMRQRLGLAVALSVGGDTPPELLILDEPASGLAPEGQVAVREVLLDCQRQGSTILLCSHQLTEVERICSKVGILRAGRLVALTGLHDESRVLIVAAARPRAMEVASHLLEYLEQLHPSVAVKGGTNEVEPLYVSLPTGNGVPHAAAMKAAALRAMVDARWDITSVHVESRDLESIYLQAVRPASKKGAESSAPEDKAAQLTPATPTPEVAEVPSPADAAPILGVVGSPTVPVTGESLPVRPVLSPGSGTNTLASLSAEAVSPGMQPSVSANMRTGVNMGPSTAPLPDLPPAPAAPSEQTTVIEPDYSWLKDLRREGEGE